jgi:hypothetical protein
MPVGERKSGMPLSVETPAPVSTTQGCAERKSSARAATSANARKQVAEWNVLQRLDDQVGVGKIQL